MCACIESYGFELFEWYWYIKIDSGANDMDEIISWAKLL